MTKRTRTITVAALLALVAIAFGWQGTLQIGVTRGISHYERSTAPGTVVTALPGDGGVIQARTAASLLELSDRSLSVLAFGAVGDGTTDCSDAFQDAIDYVKASGKIGKIHVPSGTYLITTTLAIDADYLQLHGDGIERTKIDFRGSGPAIICSASQYVRLSDFKVRTQSASANGTTDGIKFAYAADQTAYGYSIERVSVVGFDQGIGFNYTNCEHFLTSHCLTFGCKYGYWTDATSSGLGSLGINNAWVVCRAQDSLDNGWDVASQSSSLFDHCQSFSDITPSVAHFRLRGSCVSCEFRGLDVEYHGGDGPKTTGLQLSGTGHVVQINGFNLAQAIRSVTGIGALYKPQRFATCTAGLLLDSGSNNNRMLDTGYQITDQGTGNYRLGGGGLKGNYAAKTATYQILSTDYFVACDASGGAFTATLPTASTVTGQRFTIKNVGASGTVTVGGTIDGATNYSLAAQYKFLTVVSNGTNYYVEGAN